MRAMLLAAGLGRRMQPLTANIPKPLLRVGDKTLIEHQVCNLVRAGVRDIVINHFYYGEQIEALLGDGSRLGAAIQYSRETVRQETAGGIIAALPLLKDDCFIVANADIWTDFPFATLQPVDGEHCQAHLVLVNNAEHHPFGDFHLDKHGRVHEERGSTDQRLTFSGISVMHRALFAGYAPAPLPLLPLLQAAMARDQIRGEVYHGRWMDIGTPERLQTANQLAGGQYKRPQT